MDDLFVFQFISTLADALQEERTKRSRPPEPECIQTECPICNQALQEPVLLPCRHSICYKHVGEEYGLNKDEILFTPGGQHKELECQLCHKLYQRYFLKKEGSTIRLFDDWSFRYYWMYLMTTDSYADKDSSDSKPKMEKILSRCDKLKTNPFLIVFNEINEMESRIRVKKELLKENNKSEKTIEGDKLVAELDAYEIECRQNLRKPDVRDKLNKLVTYVISQFEDIIKIKPGKYDNMTRIHRALNEQVRIYNKSIDLFLTNKVFSNKLSVYKDKITEYEQL